MAKEKETQAKKDTHALEGSDALSPIEMWIPGAGILLEAVGKTVGDAIAKAAGVAGKSALDQFLSDGPVTFRVLASWFMKSHYCAALEFHNLTVHGAYLEQMCITEPKLNIDFELSDNSKKKNPMGIGNSNGYKWQPPTDYLPRYIPPLGKVELALQLKDDQEQTLSMAGVVQLTYRFTISGGKEIDKLSPKNEKTDKVLLRKGPHIL